MRIGSGITRVIRAAFAWIFASASTRHAASAREPINT